MKYAVYIFFLTLSLVVAPAVISHVQASVPLMEKGHMAAMASGDMSLQTVPVESSKPMGMMGSCPDCQECEDPSSMSLSYTPMSNSPMCDGDCQMACAAGSGLMATLTHTPLSPEQVHLSYSIVQSSIVSGHSPTRHLPPPRS